MTTILTLEPLSGNWRFFNGPGGTMKHNFGGAGLPKLAWEGATTRGWLGLPSGTQVKRVRYPASLTPRSIEDGVAAIVAMQNRTPGQLLLFGHSQGAQAISRALKRDLIDASRASVLLIGNPLRKYGGFGVGKPEVDGRIGRATPTDTDVHVTDVKLQYDGWADWPTEANMWAVQNAQQDRIGINGPRGIHCYGYRAANLTDPGRKTHTEGNTTFVMLPHPPLLRINPAWIEAGYNRPEH